MWWPKIDWGDDRGTAGWLVPFAIAVVIGGSAAILSKCIASSHAAEMPGANIICDEENCTLPREDLERYMTWSRRCGWATL